MSGSNDRIIAAQPGRTGTWRRFGLAGLGVAALSLSGAWALHRSSGGARLTVDATRLITAVVAEGAFLEYYPVDGEAMPMLSVYLDLEVGGRVEEVLVDSGQHVEKGQLLLRLGNTATQQQAAQTEAALLEQLDRGRTSQFNLQQQAMLRKDQLLDLDREILRKESRYRRYGAMRRLGDRVISDEEYETAHDDLRYLRDKRVLLQERIRREDELTRVQLSESRRSIERGNEGLELVKKLIANLEVRAPITGTISTIDARIGENVGPSSKIGSRVGQIDAPGDFKLKTKIDQFYIGRVAAGTEGQARIEGRAWPVKVLKIYPEVKDNTFEADVVFAAGVPPNIKRGQRITVELSFGSPARSLTLARGPYYQETAGRWVYRIDADGAGARRIDVRLGRQNPRDVEVLEGLRAGDRVIVSSYDAYNGVPGLRFTGSAGSTTHREQQ